MTTLSVRNSLKPRSRLRLGAGLSTLAALSAGAVLAGGAGVAVVAASPYAAAPALQHRTVPIDSQTLTMLQAMTPRSDQPYSGVEGEVLASAQTKKGEVLLVGVETPDGKVCVLQRYADQTTDPAAAGGRCAANRSELFKPGVDVSASEELDPSGDNISVVWGILPTGAERAELLGERGQARTAPATDGGPDWDHRSFFIVEAPVISAEHVRALGRDGSERGSERKPFRARN